MQQDQTHARIHVICDPFDNLVRDVAMGCVTPPKQDIGVGQTCLGQAMFGLLQSRGRGIDSIGPQASGNRLVHALGIDIGHNFVCLFVDVLAPHNCSNRHDDSLSKRFGRRCDTVLALAREKLRSSQEIQNPA